MMEGVEERSLGMICNDEARNETKVSDPCLARKGKGKRKQMRNSSRRIRVAFRGEVCREECTGDHFVVCMTKERAESSTPQPLKPDRYHQRMG
jgi:hypothetical protein